jgi:hypothetical protein
VRSHEVGTLRTLHDSDKVVDAVPSLSAAAPSRQRRRWGRAGLLMGWIAVGCLFPFWIVLVSGLLGFGDGGLGTFWLAIFGSHGFGIAGAALDLSRRKPGVMAVCLFWASCVGLGVLGFAMMIWQAIFG